MAPKLQNLAGNYRLLVQPPQQQLLLWSQPLAGQRRMQALWREESILAQVYNRPRTITKHNYTAKFECS